MVVLSNMISITNVGVEFIFEIFNQNTQEAIHVIAIYEPPNANILFHFDFRNYFGKNSH
jgi:hypothetical protein